MRFNTTAIFCHFLYINKLLVLLCSMDKVYRLFKSVERPVVDMDTWQQLVWAGLGRIDRQIDRQLVSVQCTPAFKCRQIASRCTLYRLFKSVERPVVEMGTWQQLDWVGLGRIDRQIVSRFTLYRLFKSVERPVMDMDTWQQLIWAGLGRLDRYTGCQQ